MVTGRYFLREVGSVFCLMMRTRSKKRSTNQRGASRFVPSLFRHHERGGSVSIRSRSSDWFSFFSGLTMALLNPATSCKRFRNGAAVPCLLQLLLPRELWALAHMAS